MQVEVVAFFLADEKHPVNQAFETREFQFSDQIYQYKGYDRSKLRVLVGLDSLKTDKKGNSKTNDYPVSWVRSYGKERIFTLILVTTKPLGGLRSCYGISWTVSNGH